MTRMTLGERKQALYKLGAADADMDALLAYTENAFMPRQDDGGGELPPRWFEFWVKAQAVCCTPPSLEMFESAAGVVPIICPGSPEDYEALLREFVYKGKAVPHIENMGASFVSGKTLRFIILTDKPYSGVSCAQMGLEESDWRQKSMTIRKYHECAHYYTKRFLGSSRNHLHDELIADFCGLHAAFGEYRAEWFLSFFDKRSAIYAKNLSVAASDIIRKLAAVAAERIEDWTKTEGFAKTDEAGRIECLAGKELLAFTQKTF
jgi:hypothetical protein